MSAAQSRISRRIQLWAPVTLVLALVVGYYLLNTSLPDYRSKFDKIPQDIGEHWSAPVWSLSANVAGHTTAAIVVIVVIGVGATAASLSGRPLAFLIYGLAGVIVLCDILLFLGAYSWMLTEALHGAMEK